LRGATPDDEDTTAALDCVLQVLWVLGHGLTPPGLE
jgi:hypothetical protein